MPFQAGQNEGGMNIGAIARQTGIEIATLRKWEARYGFPLPQRTPSGRRHYLPEIVPQLMAIRRQISCGQRPGQAIAAFLAQHVDDDVTPSSDLRLAEGMALLTGSEVGLFRQWLRTCWQSMPIADFIEKLAAPLARDVGVWWSQGRLPVHAEHLFSEELEVLLLQPPRRDAVSDRSPRILLTVPAGEKHTLGLRMAGAVMAAAGESPIYLPCDLPNRDIVAAASHYQVSIVGMTVSLSYPPRQLLASLTEIRANLPPTKQLWVGGAGVARLPRLPADTHQVSDMYALQVMLQTLPVTHVPLN